MVWDYRCLHALGPTAAEGCEPFIVQAVHTSALHGSSVGCYGISSEIDCSKMAGLLKLANRTSGKECEGVISISSIISARAASIVDVCVLRTSFGMTALHNIDNYIISCHHYGPHTDR